MCVRNVLEEEGGNSTKSKDNYSNSLALFSPWYGHMKQLLQAEKVSVTANPQ